VRDQIANAQHGSSKSTLSTSSKPTLSDHEIRHAIASVSLDRLREGGLLDALLRLANPRNDEPPVTQDDAVGTITAMSVKDLIRRASRNRGEFNE
jgi:hypothetical protein